MHTTIARITTAGFIPSSRRGAGAYCASTYIDGQHIPEVWWHRGIEQTMTLHFGACRVARGVYVTDCGDTSTRDCWTSQRAKVGRSE
jgi:hypothetical protein